MKRIDKAHAKKLQDMRRSNVPPKNKGRLYKNKEVIIIIFFFIPNAETDSPPQERI